MIETSTEINLPKPEHISEEDWKAQLEVWKRQDEARQRQKEEYVKRGNQT